MEQHTESSAAASSSFIDTEHSSNSDNSRNIKWVKKISHIWSETGNINSRKWDVITVVAEKKSSKGIRDVILTNFVQTARRIHPMLSTLSSASLCYLRFHFDSSLCSPLCVHWSSLRSKIIVIILSVSFCRIQLLHSKQQVKWGKKEKSYTKPEEGKILFCFGYNKNLFSAMNSTSSLCARHSLNLKKIFSLIVCFCTWEM